MTKKEKELIQGIEAFLHDDYEKEGNPYTKNEKLYAWGAVSDVMNLLGIKVDFDAKPVNPRT